MTARTDTQRLDWIEAGERSMETDTKVWQVRTYRRDGPRSTTITLKGRSVREAIDLAMDDDLLKVMDVQRRLDPSHVAP